MDMKSVCLCVLVFSLQFVCGQYSTTPCPGIFDFESDGQNVYGKITVRSQAPVSSLMLRINFTVAAQLTNYNYAGHVDALNSNTLVQRYNRGQAVNYLVYFPVTSPLPKLTALTINGDTICYGPGDQVTPHVFFTTISLQHNAFLDGGAGAAPATFYNNFQHQPQTRPQMRPQQRQQITADHIHFGDDDAAAEIYTFNNLEPMWTTGNSPNTNSFTQAQQYQPPTQQIFQSRPTNEYDEPAFQAPSRRPVPVKPMRPITPVYTEPFTNRPVYKPAVTSNPDRYSNSPEDETIECGTVSGGNNRLPLIHNGNTYDRGELPWLVAIYEVYQGTLRFICAGTLVSDRHIVTAAYCMQGVRTQISIKDIVIKVGVHNLNDWSSDIIVTRTLVNATIHKSYNPATLENNILILTLNKRVKFNNYIRPACLWSGNIDLSVVVTKTGIVAGWGQQDMEGIGQNYEPHKVQMPIVSITDCKASKSEFHKLTYNNTTLCAGDRKGSGPCTGDSGGGIYLLEGGKWRIRGVISLALHGENGSKCNLNEYVVFTDAAQFLPWIKNTLAEN